MRRAVTNNIADEDQDTQRPLLPGRASVAISRFYVQEAEFNVVV